MKSESTIQREIMVALSRFPCVRIYRNNVGMAWTGNLLSNKAGIAFIEGARPLNAGLFVGSGDLIGWKTEWHYERYIARFISLEVKGPRGRVSPAQQNWIDTVNAAGGFAGVVKSVEDALKLLCL